MAVPAFNENRILYDPHYRPDLAVSSACNRSRTWFDDFTVSEHLHILKPQSVSAMNPISSMQDAMRAQSNTASALRAMGSVSRGGRGWLGANFNKGKAGETASEETVVEAIQTGSCEKEGR